MIQQSFDCKECGNKVIPVVYPGGARIEPIEPSINANLLDIPFKCSCCGAIKFPIKPIRDIVFVWPDKLPEKVGLIHIPEEYRSHNEYGHVLSVGPGYYDFKKGRFMPTYLKPGMKVIYDKTVPWYYEATAPNGKDYHVKYMGEGDVKAIIVDEVVG